MIGSTHTVAGVSDMCSGVGNANDIVIYIAIVIVIVIDINSSIRIDIDIVIVIVFDICIYIANGIIALYSWYW